MTDITELVKILNVWLDCKHTEMAELVCDNYYYSRLVRGNDEE